MKKLILSLAVIAAAMSVSAQSTETSVKPVQFSLGLEAALPLGDFGKAYSFGIGGSVEGDYNVDPSLAITLQAGYISFSGKSVTTSYPFIGNVTTKYPSIGYIPVLGGIKYSFTPELFASAQLGLTFASGNGSSGSAFTYAPGLGYKFTPNFDALLKYTGYSNKGGNASNTIGLRVAYTF